jgi:hypothetical protein
MKGSTATLNVSRSVTAGSNLAVSASRLRAFCIFISSREACRRDSVLSSVSIT